MNKPNQLILIGGGSSIKEGISKGLWDKIKDHFIIGINYSYKFIDSTIQIWLDKKFYEENKEGFDKLPLIITKPVKGLSSNVMVLKTLSAYKRDVKNGCYKGSLSGIYALSLAIYLLDIGEIFLLGYDFGERGKGKKGRALTHYYQNLSIKDGEILEHRGVGKINYYGTKGKADRDFTPFKDEKKVKIYNVSLNSKINTFEKISYDDFFKKLDDKKFNQDLLRTEIKNKLKGVTR